jgi:hypothetical protein
LRRASLPIWPILRIIIEADDTVDEIERLSDEPLISGGASILNDAASTTTSRRPPSSNRFRLLNGKFNGSSDNLSISSTVFVVLVLVLLERLGQTHQAVATSELAHLADFADHHRGILNDAASTTTSRRPPSSNRFRLLNGKFNGSSDNLNLPFKRRNRFEDGGRREVVVDAASFKMLAPPETRPPR